MSIMAYFSWFQDLWSSYTLCFSRLSNLLFDFCISFGSKVYGIHLLIPVFIQTVRSVPHVSILTVQGEIPRQFQAISSTRYTNNFCQNQYKTRKCLLDNFLKMRSIENLWCAKIGNSKHQYIMKNTPKYFTQYQMLYTNISMNASYYGMISNNVQYAWLINFNQEICANK